MSKGMRTEDEVRDSAKLVLGFDREESGVQQGTGQITTFNQLGFRGCNDKPDGWYLPDDASKPAIILETKSETEGVSKEKHVKELFKNIDVVAKKYSKTIGILYSGSAIRVFRNKIELSDASKRLENKDYYIRLCTSQKLDSNYIFEITQKINNSLHFKFGMTDLQDRMIFTACALVAQRYNPQNGLQKLKDMDYSTFHNWIYSALSKALEEDKKQNNKLDVLLEEYASVRMSITENQEAINDFIDNVCQIADLVNSDNWNGEDVMAIFFNEFNRYRGKAQAGQVFTPDHIASFMYRLIDVNMNDRVLDATCGSGTFLVKSMCNMIREAGGSNTSKAKQIKSEQLFGIEMYRKVYALACANMMIHKDGKTNLVQMDATSAEATEWIQKQKITKALMNPPYERRYGCATIVANVLDSVPAGTECAFILPDKKMEKESKLKALLERHTLTTIIKLPENLFFGLGVTTSIFIFETGKPQNGRNPEVRKTRYAKDFSWGFYCTNNYEQAARWSKKGRSRGIVNVFEYTESPMLNIKKFPEMSDEWLDFIAICRSGKHHDYDIVEGPMADDTIWNYVNDFLSGDISREAFWALAKFKHPTHQISFHTEVALKCLSFKEAIEV